MKKEPAYRMLCEKYQQGTHFAVTSKLQYILIAYTFIYSYEAFTLATKTLDLMNAIILIN